MNLAIELIEMFQENEHEIINGILLLRNVSNYGIDCLHLAIKARSYDFFAHRSVQSILNHIWDGRITLNNCLKAEIYVIKSLEFNFDFKF